MKTNTLLLFAGLALLLSSCLHDRVDIEMQYYSAGEYSILKESLNLPKEPDNYNFIASAGVSFPFVSNSKATLGRVLFYDTKLSRNNSVSCASCHKQELAFSDDKAFSTGFDGQLTKRNSLPLAAAVNFVTSYNGGNSFVGSGLQLGFLWDERANSIHELSVLAITDPIEMGMNMNELAAKLQQEEYYRILFKKAYGDSRITPSLISEALQEFLNAFISVGSGFDEGLRRHISPAANFSNFSAVENLGKALFMIHCSGCHGQDMTTPVRRVANNGLDLNYADQGVGGVTYKPADMGVFKVPFLRNIALTAPYMHDGRFATLEEVVEHYNSGIQPHPNLHHLLRDQQNSGQPKRLNLSEEERAALVAFLNTLTDVDFLKEQRFSDPVKK